MTFGEKVKAERTKLVMNVGMKHSNQKDEG